MNEAIKLAIEKGGYQTEDALGEMSEFQIVLDPEFWKCLGVALGWEAKQLSGIYPESRWHGHRFWDWIMDGKEADEFFKMLLSPNRPVGVDMK